MFNIFCIILQTHLIFTVDPNSPEVLEILQYVKEDLYNLGFTLNGHGLELAKKGIAEHLENHVPVDTIRRSMVATWFYHETIEPILARPMSDYEYSQAVRTGVAIGVIFAGIGFGLVVLSTILSR